MKNIHLTLLLVLSSLAQAQETKPIELSTQKLQKGLEEIEGYYEKVSEKMATNTEEYIQPNIKRDPFSYTDQMYRNQQLQEENKAQKASTTKNNIVNQPLLMPSRISFSTDGLPVMKYRGFAQSPSGEVVGILEIFGVGVYTVRAGDKIGLQDIVKELVLTIEGLSRNNVIIKTGRLNEKLVVQ